MDYAIRRAREVREEQAALLEQRRRREDDRRRRARRRSGAPDGGRGQPLTREPIPFRGDAAALRVAGDER
jgi:hypothetical protein